MQYKAILKRIDDLLRMVDKGSAKFRHVFEVYIGTLSIAEKIYGSSSLQVQEVKSEKDRLMNLKTSPREKNNFLADTMGPRKNNYRV